MQHQTLSYTWKDCIESYWKSVEASLVEAFNERNKIHEERCLILNNEIEKCLSRLNKSTCIIEDQDKIINNHILEMDRLQSEYHKCVDKASSFEKENIDLKKKIELLTREVQELKISYKKLSNELNVTHEVLQGGKTKTCSETIRNMNNQYQSKEEG